MVRGIFYRLGLCMREMHTIKYSISGLSNSYSDDIYVKKHFVHIVNIRAL